MYVPLMFKLTYVGMGHCFQETSLELVVVGEDGVVESVSEQSVFGIIKDLAILKWNEEYHESTPQVCNSDFSY